MINSIHKIVKVLLLPLGCAVIAAGFLWLLPAKGFMNPALARIVVFHVPCSIVGLVATTVATWFSIAYLWKRRLSDDIKAFASFSWSLLFWILTTVTGSVFSKAQWGAYWSWDIKQGSILLLLMVFVAYFALRAAISDRRKAATIGAVYAIFALLAVPYLTLILPNSTPDTLHPKGTLEGGLDTRYNTVLWLDFLTVTLVYVWGFRLQVAIAEAGERLTARRRVPGGATVRVETMERRPLEEGAS